MELTAHRTLALREAIGRSPDVALTLLLLKLVTDTFRTSSASGSCLEASVRHVYMAAQAPDLKDTVVAKLVDERHAAWEADLPSATMLRSGTICPCSTRAAVWRSWRIASASGSTRSMRR